MNNIKKAFLAALTVFAVVIPSLAQNSTVLAQPRIGPALGFEDPIVYSAGGAAQGLPSSVAAGTFVKFTNFNFRIARGSDVTITTTLGASVTNATASNAVYFVELSPNGRVFATNSPLLVTHTTLGSTTTVRQVTISATNFGANMYARIAGLTNPGSTGNGSFFPSNVTVSTWGPLPNQTR